MKATIFLIISFSVLLLFCSRCKSDMEIDYYEISLNDTLIRPTQDDGKATLWGYFDLSLDNDKMIDLKMILQGYSYGREVTLSTKIELYNGFEIVSAQYEQTYTSNYDNSQYDTVVSYVSMPRIFQKGDTITNQLNYSNDALFLSYYNSNRFQLGTWQTISNPWLEAENKYICLRNLEKEMFCWIMIDVVGYNKIVMKKYAYATGNEFLIIK